MNIKILTECCESARRLIPGHQPRAALILGSGWGSALEAFTVLDSVPYSRFSPFGDSSIAGHRGVLHAARAAGMDILIFEGRRHWYEGLGWEPVVLPVFIARAFGATALIATNAAGAIRPDLTPGSLMLLDDHINAMGGNPLAGPVIDGFERFPDMSRVYSPRLRGIFEEAASDCGIPLKHGVYMAVGGPSYETPAEIRAYATWGAAEVGMSTVPEAIVASAAGMEVAAISCVTNLAAGIGGEALSHADVMAAAGAARPGLLGLLRAFFTRLSTAGGRQGRS